MMTSLKLGVSNDVINIKILQHKLDTSLNTSIQKQPLQSKFSVSESEYREFLSNVGFAMNQMKQWLNDDVFMFGIAFPYKMDQIDTQISFDTEIMHISSQIKDNASLFLEEEFMPEYHLPDDEAVKRTPSADSGSGDTDPTPPAGTDT